VGTCEHPQTPLLAKEFIIEPYQIFLARAKGADAILLIAAVLPNQDLKYLMKIAHSLQMTVRVLPCIPPRPGAGRAHLRQVEGFRRAQSSLFHRRGTRARCAQLSLYAQALHRATRTSRFS
jgi:hypothetical protein